MKKYKTHVVDDDELNCQLLKTMISENLAFLNCVNLSNTLEEAIKIEQRAPSDVVFLDIELFDENGYELVQFLSDDAAVVVVSAYEKNAVQAFKYNVVYFILKPVKISELINAGKKIDDFLKSLNSKTPQSRSQMLSIPHKGEILLKKFSEVLYIEASSNYSKIHTLNGSFLSSKSLKEFEEKLSGSSLIRIHNSYIVNVEHVIGYVKTKFGSLKLINKMVLPISSSRRKQVISRIGL